MSWRYLREEEVASRMDRLERSSERSWVGRVKRDFNVTAIKFKDPRRRGAPDRLVIIPGGHPLFVEQKREGEEPRLEQEDYHAWLRTFGYTVVVCYSEEEAYGEVKKRVQA